MVLGPVSVGRYLSRLGTLRSKDGTSSWDARCEKGAHPVEHALLAVEWLFSGLTESKEFNAPGGVCKAKAEKFVKLAQIFLSGTSDRPEWSAQPDQPSARARTR